MYQARAQLMIIKKQPQILPGNLSNQTAMLVEDYLTAHTFLIKSPKIVHMANQDKHLYELPSFAGVTDVESIIAGNLMATPASTGDKQLHDADPEPGLPLDGARRCRQGPRRRHHGLQELPRRQVQGRQRENGRRSSKARNQC